MRVDLNLATLLLYGLLLSLLAWEVAEPFWGYLVMGLLIAVLAAPLDAWIHARLGRRRVSALLTVLLAILVVVLPLSFLGWRLIEDTAQFVSGLTVQEVSARVETVALWSHNTFGYPETVEATQADEVLANLIPPIRSRLQAWIPRAISSVGSFLIGIVITVITAYYALADGDTFVGRLKRASPMDEDLEDRFLRQARLTVDGVMRGQLVTAGLQGALGYVAFLVAGIPNALFFSFLMAILSFIPVVGAFLVWLPAAVYLFAIGQTTLGVGMLLWGTLVISMVDNVVKPYIIGRGSTLHPLLAFIGVLGGLVAFGVIGFIMGPLVLSLLAVVFDVLAHTGWGLLEEQGGEEPGEEEGADPGPDTGPSGGDGSGEEPAGAGT